MSEQNQNEREKEYEFKPVAIEGELPLKPVGIENLKEANPKHMPPHRYLHAWWARRPTPASRLAVLSSIFPKGTSHDDILRLLQIGPKEGIDGEIAKYVESKKATEDERSGNFEEHYGYPRPFTRSPSKPQLKQLHSDLREFWDGELPTILDPTAGGGVIPFEALRYGLPTVANELNPVPTMMLKVMLEHAPQVGEITEPLKSWSAEIDEKATDQLEKYYPGARSGQKPSHYACTTSISCTECGCDLPLVKNWWLRKKTATKGVAAQPKVSDDGSEIIYDCVELPDDIAKSEFNPQNGPHSRGGAECLNCGVITETDTIRKRFKSGEIQFEIYGVKYINSQGKDGFRAPIDRDIEAMEDAANRVDSDYELHDLLTVDRYIGKEDSAEPYGVVQWRDIYTPRQLLAHYEYWQAYEEVKPKIRERHDSETADAILTLLALAAGKLVDRNSRASPYSTTKGYPENAVGGKLFSLQWAFVDNNPSLGNQCYKDVIRRIADSYQEIVGYLETDVVTPSTVLSQDAADMSIEDESIQAVVIDPPYYDSIIYSEMSDFFYTWLRKYLDDVYSDIFKDELTNKSDEAVANIAEYEDIAGEDTSKGRLAKEGYESKMSDIFSELYRVLEPGGVMTVMFTHKETDAWDTLTMSLINSGFTITATHPITSEIPTRISQQGNASADSTLLLTGRKPTKEREGITSPPSLWTDVKSDTRQAAKSAARELIDSSLTLTKTDIIISAFGPTLRVFAEAYPVVDNEDNEVLPRKALEEAREAVTQVLVEEYLEAEGIDDLDDVTEWYIISWLVHESEQFSYDEGHQLGLGLGVDIDEIKTSTKTWGKSRGDISLRGHSGRVQNINEKPENRSARIPVNPDDLSFGLALDKVHAAMHVYDVQGESACCDWLQERNFGSDSSFKATLKALLQVLPHDHEDWDLARDLAVGRTRDVLDLDFSPNVFAEDDQQTQQAGIDDY